VQPVKKIQFYAEYKRIAKRVSVIERGGRLRSFTTGDAEKKLEKSGEGEDDYTGKKIRPPLSDSVRTWDKEGGKKGGSVNKVGRKEGGLENVRKGTKCSQGV